MVFISTIQLAYLPRGDENALRDWAQSHAAFHRQVAEKAVKDGHTGIGVYPFNDILPNLDDWLFFHQADHETISSTYNLEAPPDLSYLDLDDDVNFNNWHFAHALVHQSIQKGLNL